MICALPTGNTHGWGVCGTELVKALSALADVTDLNSSAYASYLDLGFPLKFDDVVLHAVSGAELLPARMNVWGRTNIGVAFVEDNLAVPRFVPNAERYFDWIIAGSKWCAELLRQSGYKNVTAVPQGVDFDLFKPLPRTKYDGKFVIHSGGKAEFRKGHDIVVRAVAEFMKRHDDAMLQCCWWNPWEESLRTICQSDLVKTEPRFLVGDGKDYGQRNFFYSLLADNGIPLDRVIPLSQPVLHEKMPEVLAQADIGVFASRAEGGTNLALMEAMACGVPCIASYSTGHTDVLRLDNHLALEPTGEFDIVERGGMPVARWRPVRWEDVFDALEWTYEHRAILPMNGADQRDFVSRFTWHRTAHDMLSVIGGVCAS